MYFRLLALLFFTHAASAGPWFTGPLLAGAGRTIPAGNLNFEPYFFYTEYNGGFRNFETTPILTAGLTSFMDLQIAIPYDYSWFKHQNGNNIGDVGLGLGFQLLKQKEGTWLPDFRLVIGEVIPTGRYDLLNPLKFGTDQTGSGSYQTAINLNFQKLFTFENEHYIRTRLNFSYTDPGSVFVQGLNTYGGNPFTEGTVRPAKSYAIDAASEYTLTQHWVLVMEALFLSFDSTSFNGNPGVLPDGTVGSVGGGGGKSASLAPAIEYNFNANLGVIGGVWFTVTGPRAAKFTSTVIAINYFFS